jgi:LEA14-like dessication related protein
LLDIETLIGLEFVSKLNQLTRKMKKILILFTISLFACVPKKEIVLKDIRNIDLQTGLNGEPKLSALALFHNPNKTKMMLREINVEVYVDGKKAASSDQKMETPIPANNDFTVPIEVMLNLKEIGLLDTLFGFLTGKTHEVRFLGFVRVKVHGVLLKIPVDYKNDLKMKI